MITLSFFLGSCASPLEVLDKVSIQNMQGNAVSVTYKVIDKDLVESYSADVQVFRMTNRDSVSQKIKAYRLATKIIDQRVYTRMDDAPEESPGSRARSFVSNGVELVSFYSDTNEVITRGPLSATLTAKTPQITNLNPRIDASELLREAARLHYDTTNVTATRVAVTLPPAVAAKINSESPAPPRYRVFFDIAEGLPDGTEVLSYNELGDQLIQSTIPVYDTIGEMTIPMGQISTYELKSTRRLDVSDRSIPMITDLESLPLITQEHLDELRAQGNTVMTLANALGDPADPSYTVTTMEIYTPLEVNTLDDRRFRTFF